MKLEDIIPNTRFAFTLSPGPIHQYYGQPGRLFLAHQDVHQKIIPMISHYMDVELQPEYSWNDESQHLKQGPRLHYHGYCTITNLYSFLENGYRELNQNCIFKIEKLTDVEGWETYINKGKHIMEPMFLQTMPFKLYTKQPRLKKHKLFYNQTDAFKQFDYQENLFLAA